MLDFNASVDVDAEKWHQLRGFFFEFPLQYPKTEWTSLLIRYRSKRFTKSNFWH